MESDSFLEFFTHHSDKILLDLLAGSISGVCNCLTSHPMDTVKVRMQVSHDSMIKVIKNTYRNEGLLAFYKGMEFPLLAVPLINACVFSTYEFWRRNFQYNDNQPLKYWQITFAGMCAGSTAALIATPIELAKCKLQTQQNGFYKGPFDCISKMFKHEGIKGPFLGMFATQQREIWGYGAQFYVYELARNLIPRIRGGYEPTHFELLIAGGLGGIACWLFSYPQDTIKTNLQVQSSYLSRNKYFQKHKWIPDGGFFDCYRQIVKQDGWRGLWRGFDACAIRAFYANAIGFYSYEISRDYLLGNYATNKLKE